MSEGSFDLAEDEERRQKRTAIRAKNTTKRHAERRLDLCARGESALSQFEQLSLSIQDFHKLVLGIFRKTRGQNNKPTLPAPPSVDEIKAWTQRKRDRRAIIDNQVKRALEEFRRKHPKPHSNQLAQVEADAARAAKSKIKPVKFTSRVAIQNSGVKYSNGVASTCEAALALAGFNRCTFDWTSSLKTEWNEAMSTILLQEWEKCYKRGDADEYLILDSQVTSENKFQIFKRWYSYKRREYVSGENAPDTPEFSSKIDNKRAQSREKTA